MIIFISQVGKLRSREGKQHAHKCPIAKLELEPIFAACQVRVLLVPVVSIQETALKKVGDRVIKVSHCCSSD